jgi:alginate O-acetyltransferase complex protein AlgI
MLLGGLWHGAAYTYIIWGGIHGTALAIERMLGLQNDKGFGGFLAVRGVWFLVTQAMVLMAWVFFRSTSVAGATAFLGNIMVLDFDQMADWMWIGSLFLLPLVVHHLWTWAEERRLVSPLGAPSRAALAAVMAYCIVTLYAGTSEFIYFQF